MKPMLDNHMVEFGTQDKNFYLQVARRGKEEIIFCQFPESSI
jgi:hypothetical protein